MTNNPASRVAPFSLLVPVFGKSCAWWFLGESISPGELVGGVLFVGEAVIGTMRARQPRRQDS